MKKKKSRLNLAQDEAQAAINETNQKIEELGKHSNHLCIVLNDIQKLFDEIRNIPSDKKVECEKLKKIRLNWKQQAEKIESDYRIATVKNAGAGAAGVSAGVAVAALGPTAAMGIATTFGVASTGTAISSLSGVAATNAALAWLGGGALAAGGGGMAAGEAFLALAGPVGWAIACVALAASGVMFWKSSSKKKRIEDIFTLISKRDVNLYKLAIVELNERIVRIDEESKLLKDAVIKVKSYGTDYDAMTEAQQYELGSYVNLMLSSTQLENEMKELTASYQNDKLEFIKNPVVAEFLGFSQDTNFTESDLEKSILSNLQKFLMELGKGYAFVARQQHIHTEKQDYYIDLVFYNYILKCFVLIDLKTEKITHQDVGQMDMYIRMYDELKRSDGDNPTIGIVLCADTDDDIARYSVMHGNEQLFASKYKLYLPTEEELKAEIETQKAMFYLQQKESKEEETEE